MNYRPIAPFEARRAQYLTDSAAALEWRRQATIALNETGKYDNVAECIAIETEYRRRMREAAARLERR